jgi:hypothetical protein
MRVLVIASMTRRIKIYSKLFVFRYLLHPLVYESKLSTLLKTKMPLEGHLFCFAEREGFEPSIQV